MLGELVVLVEGEPSGSMPVHGGDVLTLGRAPDCNVRIRLASVSRLSARLAAEGAHAFFVNASGGAPAELTRGAGSAAQRVEVPLGQPVCLHHGDRLVFGTREFLFHYGACCGARRAGGPMALRSHLHARTQRTHARDTPPASLTSLCSA